MINVLSIIHYPIFGGPHNRNVHVAPLLKSEGVETTVLLPNEPGNAAERIRESGVEVVTIPLSRLRAKLNPLYHMRLIVEFWADVRRIRRVIRERNIHVVQINGLVNPQGAIAARLEGVPVVWQILDTFSPMLLRYAIMPTVKRLADVVMCTGRKVAEEHPGAIEFDNHLILFYPPVNLQRFKNSPERKKQARELLGLSQDSFVVGNVGNINLQKGHRTFIRAAAKLKEKIPDAKFVILGAQHENHREYIEGLWREADSLGVKLGVDLIVRDPGTDVPELEPSFDVFWMTSEPRSEGIPTVSEEAMTLEIPVIATSVGSIAEIVVDGKTGFVVEPYDIDGLAESTFRLFTDRNLLHLMGNMSHHFAVKNFGIASCAKSHLCAYKKALNI